MHNIIMTARDSFVQRGGWRGGLPTLGRVAGYGRIYCTQKHRMDIDMRSPQFTAQRKTSEFSPANPHAHCKLPGLYRYCSLPLPAPLLAYRRQLLDPWAPPGFLDGWAPGNPLKCHRNPG